MKRFLAIAIVVLSAIFYCSCATSIATPSAYSVNKAIVDFAHKSIGASYKYAAKGPNRFDCSGLVSYVYAREDYQLSGSAAHLSSLSAGIPLKKAQAGDLIFYARGKKVFHVSIISKVTSRSIWVIHSTSSRGVIEEDILASTYWAEKIYKIIPLSNLEKYKL